ncbi:hypothetical protein [Serinicoccus kebangsaanensis]|uniref:hypothetical protein n=1 Tax=Serinicoccus kebangsaanensis TaxID=2602069 RepID=UPI00124BE75B|nr:hypothetical protein [Serinicoccus kebangsaanensis]
MSWDDFPDDLGDPQRWDGQDETAAQWQMSRHLQVQLPGLVARRVPLRGVTPGPLQGVGRLRMADSTTFLVGAAQPGDLGRIVRALHNKHAITISRWEHRDEGLLLTLAGAPGREPVQVWLVGPDQPD